MQTPAPSACYFRILLLAAALMAVPLGPIQAFVAGAQEELTPIALPGGEGGIGFDDLGFSASLRKVLVPAGRTGTLDLVDPETRELVSIRGFARSSTFRGGHSEGITSVDEGGGFLFVTDRTAQWLNVVDPEKRSVASSARLASGPDYVRFVAETNEIWVTQPSAERIKVFRLRSKETPKPEHTSFIDVHDGQETL